MEGNNNKQPPKIECWRHALSSVFYCTCYLIAGPSLIVFNNKIMHEYSFSYPIILASIGVISSAIVSHFIVDMGWVSIRDEIANEFSGRKYYTHLAPVGALYAIALGAGNACYLFLGVGFVQMLKAFTPVTLLIILRLSGVEIPSKQIVISILIIFFGTVITTEATPEKSFIGLILVLFAEISEASRLVLMQHLLVRCDFTVVEAQFFIAPLAGASMIVMSIITELPRAYHKWKTDEVSIVMEENNEELNTNTNSLYFLLTMVAILGVAVNYLGYFVIRQVGSLTLKALGTVRNIGVVIYGGLFLQEPFTTVEYLGYTLTLSGFVSYTYFRSIQPSTTPTSSNKTSLKEEEDDDDDDGKKNTIELPSITNDVKPQYPRMIEEGHNHSLFGTSYQSSSSSSSSSNSNSSYFPQNDESPSGLTLEEEVHRLLLEEESFSSSEEDERLDKLETGVI